MKSIKQLSISGITISTRYIASLPYNESLKDQTKKLRNNATLSEVLFWMQVNKKKFYGMETVLLVKFFFEVLFYNLPLSKSSFELYFCGKIGSI